MDHEFMKLFRKNFYEDYWQEAIKDSVGYKEKRALRYDAESQFELAVQMSGKELKELYENYQEVLWQEVECMLECVYVLGASDRERMLRGII